jgi:hypothetical protein
MEATVTLLIEKGIDEPRYSTPSSSQWPLLRHYGKDEGFAYRQLTDIASKVKTLVQTIKHSYDASWPLPTRKS